MGREDITKRSRTPAAQRTPIQDDSQYWEMTVKNVLAACLSTRLEKAGITLDPADTGRMIVLQPLDTRGGLNFHWNIDASSLTKPQKAKLEKAFPGFRDSEHPLGPSMLERIMVDKLQKLFRRNMELGLVTAEHKLGTFHLGAGNTEMYGLGAMNETDLIKGLNHLQTGFKLAHPVALKEGPKDQIAF